MPWAATGHAVITPDFTGMGNEGVQAYLNNRDQAYAVLDGARALRKLFQPGTFSDQVAIAGFSQGGGASLSAHALAKSYGAGGTLAAVVAYAPQWPVRDDSFAFVDLVTKPTTLISYDPLNLQFNYSNHVIRAQRACPRRRAMEATNGRRRGPRALESPTIEKKIARCASFRPRRSSSCQERSARP